jgi:hypothetical protein
MATTPLRIVPSDLPNFVGRMVRLCGKIVSLSDPVLVLACSDSFSVNVIISPGSLAA